MSPVSDVQQWSKGAQAVSIVLGRFSAKTGWLRLEQATLALFGTWASSAPGPRRDHRRQRRRAFRRRPHPSVGELDVEALAGFDRCGPPQRTAVEAAHQGKAPLQYAAIGERGEQLACPLQPQVAVVEQVLDRALG